MSTFSAGANGPLYHRLDSGMETNSPSQNVRFNLGLNRKECIVLPVIPGEAPIRAAYDASSSLQKKTKLQGYDLNLRRGYYRCLRCLLPLSL